MLQEFRKMEATANRSSAMESGDHFKNGTSLKNHTSKEKYFLYGNLKKVSFILFAIIGFNFGISVNAQNMQESVYNDGKALVFLAKETVPYYRSCNGCGDGENKKAYQLVFENISDQTITIKYCYKSVLYNCDDDFVKDKTTYREKTLKAREKSHESGYIENTKMCHYYYVDSFSVIYVSDGSSLSSNSETQQSSTSTPNYNTPQLSPQSLQNTEIQRETGYKCPDRVNGICITEDIGGVTAEPIKWNHDANSAQVNFTNYNNSVVTVVYEVTSSKGISGGVPVYTDTERGTVVLRKDESKAVNIQGGHHVSTKLVVRNLHQSQTQTEPQTEQIRSQIQSPLQSLQNTEIPGKKVELNKSASDYAHVNIQEIFQLMPETAEMQRKLKQRQEQITAELSAIENRYNTLLGEYQNNQGNWSEPVLSIKLKELQSVAESYEKHKQSSQENIQKMQADLVKPIEEKIKNAIQMVGDENNFSWIFDMSILLYAGGIDATSLVKQKLGI